MPANVRKIKPDFSSAVSTPDATYNVSNISLACFLLTAASDCFRAPMDAQYGDALLMRAFRHLRSGLEDEIDSAALTTCANIIEGCNYLSAHLRRQLGDALHGVASGAISPVFSVELVAAAMDAHASQRVREATCAIAWDGLDAIATAISDLSTSRTEG